MKLQLINAPNIPLTGSEGVDRGELGENMAPPLSLLYLAAQVRTEIPDLQIKVTDGLRRGFKTTRDEVDRYGPDVVGISSFTVNAPGAYDLSRWIKRKSPKTLVVIGGIHATALPEETLKKSRADFVGVGEGERILVELIKKYQQEKSLKKYYYERVRGIGYLEKNRLKKTHLMPLIDNLDTIPFPARDLIDICAYTGWPVAKEKPETSIFSIRGCPFDCHFCANQVWKMQRPFLRLRSPKNVIDEVEILVKDYGIKEYFEQADELNATLNWAVALCQEKIDRKLDIPWKAQIRADKMTKEIAGLLAKSGCWYVHLGIESGNQRTIDEVGKHITLEQVVDSCKMLKKEGIKICGLFMFFNAWEKNGRLEYENVADCQKTIDFARSLFDRKLMDNMTWSQATPYPGSALYDTSVKYNLIPKKYQGKWQYWNNVWSFTMELPGISDLERQTMKMKGTLLEIIQMLKTGNLPLNVIPHLIIRGLGFIKRSIWINLKSFFLIRSIMQRPGK